MNVEVRNVRSLAHSLTHSRLPPGWLSSLNVSTPLVRSFVCSICWVSLATPDLLTTGSLLRAFRCFPHCWLPGWLVVRLAAGVVSIGVIADLGGHYHKGSRHAVVHTAKRQRSRMIQLVPRLSSEQPGDGVRSSAGVR